jgi:hypothetical protein
MTELIQPLAAAPSRNASTPARSTPSFTELVYAHFAWWRAVRENGGGNTDAATEAYQDTRSRFEREHGRIVHAFWCSHVESAVALVERPRRSRWQRRQFGLHRESDWATKGHPAIASELHRCDELAVRAQSVLTGVRQRICLQLVAASAAHLLSLVDSASGHTDDAALEQALDRERNALAKTTAYYRQAANGQAQIAYFAGLAFVAAIVAATAGVALAFEFHVELAAFIAGAAGGVVSVIQRINAGDFELEYDVGRPYAFFLGGLRPLIGGALALAIAFAFTSGIMHPPISTDDPNTNRNVALVVISFLAGFSERWAQDTLATALPTSAPEQPPDPGPAPAPAQAPAPAPQTDGAAPQPAV